MEAVEDAPRPGRQGSPNARRAGAPLTDTVRAAGLRVLVVDDEPGMRLLLGKGLQQAGYEVVTAMHGPQALAAFLQAQPDLVLLDVLMPGMDGYEVCRRLRRVADVPIVMVSALRNEDEIVRGLEAGADDYVTKPFGVAELVARLAALRRRYERAAGSQPELRFGGGQLQIDLLGHKVQLDGQPLQLGPTEFRLLAYLALNAARVVPHAELVEQIWGPEGAHLEKYLKVYVGRLRRKLEPTDSSRRYVVSVHGVGYRLDPQPSSAVSPERRAELREDGEDG